MRPVLLDRIEKAGRVLSLTAAFPGRLAAWLILPMIGAVLFSVVASKMRWGKFGSWTADLPIFGSEFTAIGLAELQWHLFAILVMLCLAYAVEERRHVRVDMIYANLPDRLKLVVELIGGLLLMLPFCVVIGWISLGFVEFSFRTGEGSDYGGLQDRYLIKSVLPVGLFLLGLSGLGQVLTTLSALFRPGPQETVK